MTTAALGRPLVRVVSWQPLGWVMAAGVAFVSIGSRSGVALRFSVAGAGVAAATAFLLDDPAAGTLAASPTPLSARRLHRVAVAAAVIPLWSTVAVSIGATHGAGLPLRGRTLELTVLVVIALAVSAAAATMGDRTGGGVAGAACSAACFASTFLPPRWWLPFPADPSGPGASHRLAAILACAIALLAWTSRDPARRNPGRRRTQPQHRCA